MLALPLTAAVLLHATPTQMGLLTAMEIVPFVLFSLPAGVWLDRVRKLPVYIAGELHDRPSSSPACRSPGGLGWLSIGWLYVVGFVDRHGLHDRRQRGADRADPGRAARAAGRGARQERARLVGRRGRGARARRRADQGRRRAAGAARRRRAAGVSARDPARRARSTRRGASARRLADAQFWRDLKAGVRFVARHRLLVALAVVVGTLAGLPPRGDRRADPVRDAHARPLRAGDRPQLHRRWASAPSSRACSATASAAASARGRASCSASRSAAPAGCCSRSRRRTPGASPPSPLMLMMFSTGAVLIFINFLALAPGGDAGAAARPDDEHDALADPDSGRAGRAARRLARRARRACARRSRSPAAARCCSRWSAWRLRRDPRPASLPEPERDDDWLGAEADVRPQPATERASGTEEEDAMDPLLIDVPERIETERPRAALPAARRRRDGQRRDPASRSTSSAPWLPWAGTGRASTSRRPTAGVSRRGSSCARTSSS